MPLPSDPIFDVPAPLQLLTRSTDAGDILWPLGRRPKAAENPDLCPLWNHPPTDSTVANASNVPTASNVPDAPNAQHAQNFSNVVNASHVPHV